MLSVPPGPARAQIEFPDAIRRGSWIVKSFSRKHDPQLAEESIQHRTAVSQAGKFHTIPIDVLNNGTPWRHDQFSQSVQIVHFASKELNQLVRVINRARINDHSVDYIRENNPRRPHV
jgi:hypothetical protein